MEVKASNEVALKVLDFLYFHYELVQEMTIKVMEGHRKSISPEEESLVIGSAANTW